tara:strand:- start:6512 stop:7255 length:744 start_codon:yes stop_codon:yes gene_type:complete
MFDPIMVKDEDLIDVTEIQNYSNKVFRAHITLPKSKHDVLMKINFDGKNDQVVADRMKYLFDITPMHTFFVNYHDINHFCFAFYKGSRLWNQKPIELENNIFQIEMCKILIFRFVIGSIKTNADHIMIVDELPMSISEIYIGNHFPDINFLKMFTNVDIEYFIKARELINKNFSHDAMRGIILQNGKRERNINYMRCKYPLSVSALRLTELMEEKLDLITSCDIDVILLAMLHPDLDRDDYQDLIIS